MRRLPAVLLLAAAALPAAEEVPKPGVAVERFGPVTRVHAVCDGSLDDVAVPGVGSRRELLAVVTPLPPEKSGPEACTASKPADTPEVHRLVRVEWRGAGALESLRDGVPPRLAADDADGDGTDDVLLASAGTIRWLARGADGAWSGELRTLLEDRDLEVLNVPSLGPAEVPPGPGAFRHLGVPGALRAYGPAGEGAGWTRSSESELPKEVAVRADRLIAYSPQVRWVGRAADGPVFATQPRAVGAERLRTRVVRARAGQTPLAFDSWLKLPAAEELLEHEFLLLDGQPALVVLTRRSDKLRVFGEKLVRVHALEADRTRAGRAPLGAFESRANLWQDVTPLAHDYDGDRREDLLLAYWKGDDTLMFDLYARQANGGFAAAPRSSSIGAKKGDGAFLVLADVDADGVPDALVKADRRLLLYPGRADARRPFAREPAWAVPLPKAFTDSGGRGMYVGGEGVQFMSFGNEAETAVVDLDGDGTREVVMLGRTAPERGELLVIGFHGRQP
ncbi:MAG: VCBS repeat-containing protein [Acidobacteria bacterium]|nr:VCBS repeat-containing protein [Acidobacteriota bacterium]